jgi:hypothetical protein
MKKFAIALTLFSVAAWAETWTGTISDEHCGAKHEDASEKSIACAQKCVKGGAAPVFILEGKVIKIANPDAVADQVGHKVKLTGDLKEGAITVEKVTPAE